MFVSIIIKIGTFFWRSKWAYVVLAGLFLYQTMRAYARGWEDAQFALVQASILLGLLPTLWYARRWYERNPICNICGWSKGLCFLTNGFAHLFRRDD